MEKHFRLAQFLAVLLYFNVEVKGKGDDPASLHLENRRLNHHSQNRATDLNGIPYPSLTATQSIGVDGPALMQDRFLLERIASFNRERIQERGVHAKGMAAHGTFTVTHDISRWTKARFLSELGKQTPVFLRFSSTGGEIGFPDTVHDARGFAVKFYTEDGNFDITGNQLEVFNTRDPMLFVDINTSRKRNPQTHCFDPTMKWDFNQGRPETVHHTLKLFSDMNFAESMRMINGSGVHTFKLVNDENVPFYCKFHFISHQKFQSMSKERSTLLAGVEPNHYQKDLYNAIVSGNFPRWTFAVQVATVAEAQRYRWNYLDITKNWRFDDFPLHPVGILELNKMPVDFFAFTEQVAFSPANLVIGIEPSEDRMLHARMMSYPNAQNYRLGVNYNMLPVNRPVQNVTTYERDGHMCFGDNDGGGPNYYPNSFNGLEVDPTAEQLPFSVSGEVFRSDTRDVDNFSQAKLYLERDVSPEEKLRIAVRIGSNMALVASEQVRELVLETNFRPLGGDFEQLVRVAMENALRNPPKTIPERV